MWKGRGATQASGDEGHSCRITDEWEAQASWKSSGLQGPPKGTKPQPVLTSVHFHIRVILLPWCRVLLKFPLISLLYIACYSEELHFIAIRLLSWFLDAC